MQVAREQRAVRAFGERCKAAAWAIASPSLGSRALLAFAASLAAGVALAAPAPPPVMPASYDAAALRSLIAGIDRGPNASILKAGYFTAVAHTKAGTADGYGLLTEALHAETPGSARWAALASVAGYAAFRQSPADVVGGLEVYSALFNRAPAIAKAGGSYWVQSAVSDYVAAARGRFGRLRIQGDAGVRDELMKAWLASTQITWHPGWTGAEPEWGSAVQALGAEDAFRPAVEKALADPNVPKTYQLLRTAAMLFQWTDRPRAIALLKQALPLAPTEPTRRAPLVDCYDRLVSLLSADDKLADAITVQRQKIRVTGRGSGELAVLLLRAGDRKGYAAVVAGLEVPTADERDLNEASVTLEKYYAQSKASRADVGEDAAAILHGYLAADRQREPVQELSARITLARLLAREGKPGDAKDVLSAVQTGEPSPETAPYRQEVDRLKKLLDHAVLTQPKEKE